MAFTHGKDAHFSLANASGTVQNLSTYTDSVSGLPAARQFSEVTAFGDEGVRNIPGLQNVTFSASGSFDSTTSGPHDVLNSLRTATSTASFEYGPEGNASGNVKISGQCWLSSYTVDASVSDKVPWSAEFQVDGTVTVGTFA